MLASQFLLLLWTRWPVVTLIASAAFLLHNKLYKGLSKYPGPWLASWTIWWRFADVYSRRAERTNIELHRKYGDIVRIGPDVLSFADPQAVRTIYGLNRGMTKSAFYPIQQAVARGRRLQSLFSTRDEAYHARYRRCVNGAFAMSSLVSYEPLVNETIDLFIRKTREYYVETGSSCNMSRWLQYFAFDVIGGLTWSKRLGFIERNDDVDGILAFLSGFMTYAGIIGQVPFLDLLWKKNPIKLQLQRWGLDKTIFPVTRFALERNSKRAVELDRIKRTGLTDEKEGRGIDLLTKFQLAQYENPDFMTDDQVLAACTSMVIAGSETTAISLGSVFYHLLKHPQVYEKLMAELDENAASGVIADRDNHRVSWAESQKLPYLDAVIQESFRMHPAAGLILERVTPPQGIIICGEYIPGDVIVGCNAWVLHRRTEVFGADVDSFRPERWLDASTSQLKEMKAAMFQFGAGPRTCIGKNISLLEIYKLVPTFLRNFEVQLDCDEWEIDNSFFVRQKGFRTRFKLRSVQPSA